MKSIKKAIGGKKQSPREKKRERKKPFLLDGLTKLADTWKGLYKRQEMNQEQRSKMGQKKGQISTK